MSTTRALFTGQVLHERFAPVANRFLYGVYFVRVPIGRETSLQSALFSIDRFNLLSFHRRDHGARDGGDLLAWIRALLAREGITTVDGEIELQAFPRVLGYVFNPVSFWFCRDRDGALRAILCDVNNTFGEHHRYLLAHADQRPISSGEWLTARKVFHVSPFFPVEGRYHFRFAERQDRAGRTRTTFRIDYEGSEGTRLVTSISGVSRPLTAGNVLTVFMRYPLMTLGVIARIHWQAVKLWLRGVPFFRKPRPPKQELTREEAV